MGDSVILAGDVGATKTILGLFSSDNGRPALLSQQTFRSSSYPGLAPMVREFMPIRNGVKRACFGVAGPVVEGVGEVTNLAWTMQAQALASDLHIESVSLINDLVATGFSVAAMGEEDFLVLNQGRSVPLANKAVIAAGTGLGECVLNWDGRRYAPLPSEAGHSDFAPHDEITLELTGYIRRQTGFACVEQVLSGRGLVNIYDFLRDTGRIKESPAIAEEIRTGDSGAVITRSALENRCDLCVRALDIFVSVYGSEAGNLALRAMAVGGIYLGGGIAPKILSRLRGDLFMKAFMNKEKQSALLAQVPVRVILNDKAPLLGAVGYLLQQS